MTWVLSRFHDILVTENWSFSDPDPKLIIPDPAYNFGSNRIRIHNTSMRHSFFRNDRTHLNSCYLIFMRNATCPLASYLWPNAYLLIFLQAMTDNELYSMFITCGPLVSAKIMRDRNSGYSYGYGFVQYQVPYLLISKDKLLRIIS